MKPEKGVWSSIWGGFFGLLILVVPTLTAYNIFVQWRSPTMDFFLDSPGSSTVHSVIPGGHSEAAGLEVGDVILVVDDIPFENWYSPQIGHTHILKIERRGEQSSLVVPAVRVFQLSYLHLTSASVIALVYWGIGSLLLLRRFWHPEIRLLFLLAQTIAITILFPLSYRSPLTPPPGLLSISVIAINLTAPLYVHYMITFPVKLGHAKRRFWGLLTLYSFVPIIFWSWSLNNQLGLQLSIIYFSLVVTAGIVFMIYVYQDRAASDERRRLRIIVFGTMMAGLPPILFYLLPTTFNSPYSIPEWAVGLFLIIAPLSYLYTTMRYNLFGIDHLINRTLVYVFLFFGFFIVYLGPYLFLYQYLPDDLYIQIAFIFGLMLWVGWTFDWIRSLIQRLVDRFFYGSWYDYPEVVETASNALARSSTREQIIDVLTSQISDLMRLNSSNLWIGDLNSTFPAISPKQSLIQFHYKFQSDIPAQWTVGSHRDGDDLSDTDHRILHTLAQQAEIALNNAFLIEKLRHQLDEIRSSREVLTRIQHQLLRSREEERSRLARDLHDGPIQSLVGLNIQLGLLLDSKDFLSATKESLKEMRMEVRQLSSELRQVCTELRPPMLDALGLGAAIRTFANEWSEQNDVKAEIDLSPDTILRSLPEEVTVNLYRVAQEALFNIGKHAQAEQVHIFLSYESNHLTMMIRDNAVGFTMPDTLHGLTEKNHFGVAGMRERVDLIGGEWSLNSAPGEGTMVSVIWYKKVKP